MIYVDWIIAVVGDEYHFVADIELAGISDKGFNVGRHGRIFFLVVSRYRWLLLLVTTTGRHCKY